MSWLSIPWSVQSVVRRDEREWQISNTYRRRYAYSRLERELLFAGEHPFRFAFSIFALQLALLVLAKLVPSDWFTITWEQWGAGEHLSYFSTIWAVQATLAALVYPIVIAFVAVFLQRRPAAEAFVHLYMLDSGALAAGLSSLVLVGVMGVQYLMLSTWSTTALPAWVVLDTAWFLLNSALTTYFLFRTVDFLRPDVQTRVVQRYTVNVALPRDVARLNSYQVLAGAQSKGWLPVPVYGDDSAPEGPRLLIGQFGFRDGEVQGERRFKEPFQLVDVRLWFVRLVVTYWCRKANNYPRPTEPNHYGINKAWPLLTLPMTPGVAITEELTLATVADGPPLELWQRLLLRWSLILRPVSRERYGIQVGSILGELASDAQQAASRGESESFNRAYDGLVSMHGLLLKACIVPEENGEMGSWALLPDTSSLFGRTLHENWSEVYRHIFLEAIHNMVNDTRPLRRLCNLILHFQGDQLQDAPVEIQEHLLQLPPLMMYLLGNWWSYRVEEQGIMNHGYLRMVMLRPPLNRVYDEVLSSFVSGWENGRSDPTRLRHGRAQMKWNSAPTLARLHAKHIVETARMLLAAVHRGDQAAAEWLADVLSKWWGTFNYVHEPYQFYDKTAFITLDHLNLEWTEFKRLFGLEESDAETLEQIEQSLQHGAYLIALRNFWTDIRLLVIELMMDWIGQIPGTPPKHSLAIDIVVGLLTGKQWRSGGEAGYPLSKLTAAEYLIAKVRQFAASGKWREGYVGRLDNFVERIKDMDRPNMVGSRIYSFSGADDVESLRDSQLALLAVLSANSWEVPRTIQRQIDQWMEEQYPSIDIVRNQLQTWMKRLDEEQSVNTEFIALLRQRTRPDFEAFTTWDTLKANLNAVLQAIENRRDEVLAEQPIDENRLLEIARFASATGFSRADGKFPLPLFQIEASSEAQQNYTLTINKFKKGELTRLEMDQRASNESEFFAESLARQVAVVVLTDVFHQCTVRELVALDADSYWYAIKVEAAKISARGETPILLLDNPTRPAWVWDWQHADYGADYKRPEGLRVHRREGRGDSYVCNFNDIEVYVAPISNDHSLLMSRNAFLRVTFTNYGDGRFVKAEVPPSDTSKSFVDLRLTFSRRVEVGEHDLVRLVYSQS